MKKEYIIIIFLLLGPFLDVASFLGTSISIMIRGLFLANAIVYLIINKKDFKILLLLLLFGTFYLTYQLFYLHFNIISSLSAVLKFLYLPISILYFKNYILPIKKQKIFSIILFTYVGIYLLSYILGIGAEAYLETDGKSGFKGLFSSINEFSGIVVCLLPIITTYLKEQKKFILLIVSIILSFLCSLLIGTKVLMGGVLFTILYLLWQEKDKLFCSKSKKVKVEIIIFSLLIIVVGCFLFTKTRTYQNMMIQQDFFQVEHIISLDFVNRIIYNDRLTFLQDNFNYFKNQNIIQILFGIGLENYNIKMVEIDIFDILFRYGLVGLILFIGSISYLINFQKIEKINKVSLILLILISLTSGHVLFYPAVCIYIALL